VARSITDPDRQMWALIALVETLARAGLHQQAETIARSITDPDDQVLALASLVEALATAGHHQQAQDLAHHIETITRSIIDLERQAEVLASLATALAKAGQHQQAETIGRSITDAGQRTLALIELATAVNPSHAQTLIAQLVPAERWENLVRAIGQNNQETLLVFAQYIDDALNNPYNLPNPLPNPWIP
jgi:lipopolysaccharide biosynthesis regulator YciM